MSTSCSRKHWSVSRLIPKGFLRSEFIADLNSLAFDKIRRNINEKIYAVDDDIKQEFEKFRAGLTRGLDGVSISISNAKKKQEIAPVMKWGQNASEVFIFLKLSHRFDAPGCLELIKDPEVKVQDKRLTLRAECVQATLPMVFVLDFDMMRSVESVKVTRMSVGTYELTIKKKEKDIWEDLLFDFDERSKYSLKVWYELEDVYPEDMEEFYDKMDKYFKQKKEAKKRQLKASQEVCPFEPNKFIY